MNENSIILQKIYTINTKDLVDIWVESFHHLEHVLVIHDALNHHSLLEDTGILIDETKLYDNKILTILVSCLEDALELMKCLPIEKGPYVQVYSMGKYITDNIEK